MACDLTLGRLEPCKDSVGGLDRLIFLNYQEYVITKAGGLISDIKEDDGTTDPTGYEYIINDQVSNLTQNINSSRDNGTTFVEQVITAQFKKITSDDNVELLKMAHGRPLVIVQDKNLKFWLVGELWGIDTSGTAVTGAAMGDLNGYTLTLTGMEREFAPEIDASVVSAMTIVKGS